MDPFNLSMRFGFITFRAHESEPQVFEDFLTIFLPILHTTNFYAYTIEEDNTPDKHIHAFFALNSKQIDKSKIDQKFNTKLMKEFKNSIKLKQTQWQHAYDSKLVGNTYEDVMKTLGYTMKQIDTDRRRSVQNISDEVLTQALDFYRSTARIKNSCLKNDWKQINAKNFHILCEHFAKQNNMTVHDYELIAKMTHARHTFNIPDKMLKKHLAELKFANKDYDPESSEFRQINNFQIPDDQDDWHTSYKDMSMKYNIEKDKFKKYKEKYNQEKIEHDLNGQIKSLQFEITKLKKLIAC